MQHSLNTNLTAAIANDIRRIEPFDNLEQAHQQDALQWIATGTNIFRLQKPDIPPKHLVSYFVLVDPKQQSILLVDHIKAQLWLPTGGHVKFNEHPREAVAREAQEELHMAAPFLHSNDQPFFITNTLTGGLTPGHTDVSLWYLVRAHKHHRLHYDKSEFNDVEWYTFNEVLESDPVIFDPHLPRFTKKLAQRLS